MIPVRRPGGRALLLAAAVMVGAAACGPTTPPASTPPDSATVSPPPPTPSEPTPSEPSPTTSSAAEAPPTLPPGVTVDTGLLEVLPTGIDGVTLEADSATAAEIGSDPLLADSTVSLAVALAVAPGPSDSEDLAIASVIRLRPDVFDEAFYQEWRDTYNEAACEVADGVEAEDETEIAGRVVYVGTCVGGARTYHTYLVDQGFIVSITATGERRFGELIMTGLAG